MIKIIKELDIEVSKPNVFQAVVAKQYDMNTRFIKATFVDGPEKILMNPSATLTVVINAERPDGEAKGFDGVINEDGTVTVPLHSWMLEQVGTVICDISVIDTAADDNRKLTTTSFTLLVEKAAYGGEDITSDPQYDVLLELIEQVKEALGGVVVDQKYSPDSKNAQSGIAVKEAIENKQDKFAEVTERDGTVTVKSTVSNNRPPTFVFKNGVLELLAMHLQFGDGVGEVSLNGLNNPDDSLNINVNGNRIRNLADPKFDNDAVNKKYIDEMFSKLVNVAEVGQ